MFNNEKDRYILQPYFVGGDRKSMAVIIPARIRKTMKLDASAAFELRWNKENR
jgi:hypothetical protein